MLEQRACRGEREPRVGAAVARQDRCHQQAQVLAPLGERRQRQIETGQPRQQIATEAPGGDLRPEIDVGRGDDAHVDLDRQRLADRHHLALLQHPQQRGLGRRRQIADLVEQQRALVGAADVPGAIVDRARERTLLVTEQLSLDQVGRQRPAVHRDEGAAPLRRGVDGARHQLLAGAGRAADQHGDPGARGGGGRGQLRRQLAGERRQPGQARRELLDAQVGRAGDRHRAVAEQHQRATDLEHVAVGDRRAADGPPVDERAVLRAEVLDDPRAADARQPRVLLGGRGVGQPHGQPAPPAARPPLDVAHRAAPQLDLIHVVEQVPRARRPRLIRRQRHDQLRRLAGRAPVVVAHQRHRLDPGPGHAGILPERRGSGAVERRR